MIPHKQKIKHDPENGAWGDCGRTAYASILNLEVEAVPHFFDNDRKGPEVEAEIDAFLASHGLARINLVTPQTPAQFMEYMGGLNPDLYYILTVGSPRADHAIVCQGGRVVCDPASYPEGTEWKVTSNGDTWCEILVPLLVISRAPAPEQGKGEGT